MAKVKRMIIESGVDLSEELLEASKNGIDGIVELLDKYKFTTIKNLEKNIINQFRSLDEKDKPKFADNIILANALPINAEFVSIASNDYTLKQYIKSRVTFSPEKSEKYYGLYQEFITYSKELRNIIYKKKNALEEINSKKLFKFRKVAMTKRKH